MENASKALLIAGGILISVLILSVCIMVYNNMTSLSNSNQKILEAEQLAKYNMEWESYNRDNLRGADVISIYNKAMDVNEKYKKQEGIDYDMITVCFKLKNEVEQEIEEWEWDTQQKQYKKIKSKIKTPLTDNKVYKTSNNSDLSKIKEFMTTTDENNEYTIEILGSSTDNGIHKNYKRSYNAKAVFKLLNFKCANTSNENESGLKYDKYGRITEIHLVEI